MKHSRSHGPVQVVLLSPFGAGTPHIVSLGAVSHGRAVVPQQDSEYGQSCLSNQTLRIVGKGWLDHLLSRSPSWANARSDDEGEGM